MTENLGKYKDAPKWVAYALMGLVLAIDIAVIAASSVEVVR